MFLSEALKVLLMQVSKTPSLLVSLLLGTVLSTPLSAAPPLSSSVQEFQENHVYGNPLIQSLVSQLKANYDDAMEILASAIASSPGSIGKIIKVAINEGVLPVDIAAQCETALTAKQLRTLITTALNERIDPVPIVERCLILVDEAEIPDLLAIAIDNSTPGQIEFVIQAAYNSFSSNYPDPFQLVKTGVLQSNAFTVEGLDSTEGIDALLDEIKLQDMLETVEFDDATGQEETVQDDFESPDPEPPNSSS